MISNTLPQSLIDNPRLDQWIGFEEGGRVRLATGKVEIGQGVLTALAQIAADELDIAPTRLRIVSGETGTTPSEGTTSGSNSVSVSGSAIRLVCAEVRALLLDHAARALGCAPGDLMIDDGHVMRGGRETGRDYWSLAAAVDLARPATGSAPTKRPTDYRVVGTSLPRLDLPAKVTGAAYIHDLAPPGLLHARMLHRPWRGARLASLDEAAIRKAARAPIEILREGDLVAITAEDETATMRAAEAGRLVAVWDGGVPAPAGLDQPDWLRAQPSRDRVIETGERPAAVAGRRVEAIYSRPLLAHGSIGTSCALAEFRDGALTVWTHSQGPTILRTWLTRTLGLDPSRVTVLHRQGAGCYGHNPADDAAFDAAFVATRVPGRPVRVAWTREDEMSVEALGSPQVVRLAAALDDNGRPADWTMDIWSPVHAQRPGMNGHPNLLGAAALPNAMPPPAEINDAPDAIGGGATRNAVALYDLPYQKIVHHLLDQFPVRTSSLRGLGAFANVFAIESFMDELAAFAGEDPVRYRLALTSDPRARRVIEAAAETGGWFGSKPADGRARGFGFARYKNRAAYMAAVADVDVAEEVRVTRIWAAVDAGLVISPDGARSQVEGGIVQAVSWTLKEQVRFDNGRVVSDTWETYPILKFSEVPEIDIRLVGEASDPTLGLGEVAQGPTAAAIGNAVARALGARIRDLPLTRERIMAALLA